jgi:hypothetical protein
MNELDLLKKSINSLFKFTYMSYCKLENSLNESYFAKPSSDALAVVENLKKIIISLLDFKKNVIFDVQVNKPYAKSFSLNPSSAKFEQNLTSKPVEPKSVEKKDSDLSIQEDHCKIPNELSEKIEKLENELTKKDKIIYKLDKKHLLLRYNY